MEKTGNDHGNEMQTTIVSMSFRAFRAYCSACGTRSCILGVLPSDVDSVPRGPGAS